MKVLIVGNRGMLGSAMMAGFGKDVDLAGIGRAELDIGQPEACRDALHALRPDVVINAAGLTRVDYCETHEAEAFEANAAGPENLARAAESNGALLVHFSTDYVFDGLKPEPYLEDDATNPLSVYGRSKLSGEERVRRYCPNHLILRISWLFGPNGNNFIRKILDAAKTGRALRVVRDQRGSPTYARDVVAHTRRMIAAGCRSTYHLTNSGACSWYELALEALKYADLGDIPVEPVSSEEFRLPAHRPSNSVLANERLVRDGLPVMRSWNSAVEEYVRWYINAG